jgi:hypothetical protein
MAVKIKKIRAGVGSVILTFEKDGVESESAITVEDALRRAQALAKMRDKQPYPDEAAKIQKMVEDLIAAMAEARQKAGDNFYSSNVSQFLAIREAAGRDMNVRAGQ